jgi:group I intron endonuclease
MKATGIYSIKNITSGKKYIGQAVNIERRVAKHFYELRGGRHHCGHLQHSFLKHGEQSFTHEIIEMCSKENLTCREQFWIDYYKDRGIYNISLTAGGSTLGTLRSAETKRKITAALTGKKRSPECCARISAGLLGKKRGPRPPFSVETREKMGAAHRGKPLTPDHVAKLSASLIGNSRTLGHKLSLDHKEKIGAAHRGKRKSVIANAKASITLKGHTVSQATRDKMSTACLGRKRSMGEKERISLTLKQRYRDGLIGRQGNGHFAGIT